MAHVPIRMCIFCKKRLPKGEMKRFILVDSEIVEDKSQKLEGRGAYCCIDELCISKLENDKKGLLKRALKKKKICLN